MHYKHVPSRPMQFSTTTEADSSLETNRLLPYKNVENNEKNGDLIKIASVNQDYFAEKKYND